MFTIGDLVRLNVRRHPDAVAAIDSYGRVTHAELSARAWALARGLAEAGVRPGDTVGVLAGNGIFSAETFLGVATAGAAYVPYNWRWTTDELIAGINETAAGIVLVEERHVAAAEAALEAGGFEKPVRLVRQSAEYEAFLRPGGGLEVRVDAEAAAAILYTGGTTGVSKGVVLSHRAMLANAVNELVDCGVGQAPQDIGLILTPMFHSAALCCWFLPHYVTGRPVYLMDRFEESAVADVVARERVTNAFMTPNMIRRMLKTGQFDNDGFRRHFRALHSGAGQMRMPDKEALRELLPDIRLFFRYGLTEAGPMVTRLQPQDVFRAELDGSIGKEYTLAEVELRQHDGSLARPGEVGEIHVRGPGLMTGYFNRPEATAAVLRDGWLRTGDLAERDEQGYLYFRDRIKDMIKSGGENVYSSEVEQVLHLHPAVMECAVLGVPSLEWDEEVRAVVTLRPGWQLQPQDLQAHVRQHLAGYKVPKSVQFVEHMPVNPSGKVVKAELRLQLGWD